MSLKFPVGVGGGRRDLMMLCPICEGPLDEAPLFSGLPRVTSDCRPWPAGGSLGSCGSCGGIAKPLNAEFLASAASIYAGYAPYAQGAGNEQRVFSESGASDVRSSGLPTSLRPRCASHRWEPSSISGAGLAYSSASSLLGTRTGRRSGSILPCTLQTL